MSSLTHIFGNLDDPKIECAADEPCIWIRARHDTVSLTLNREQRDKLRAALDECDEMEKPIHVGGVIPSFSRELPDRRKQEPRRQSSSLITDGHDAIQRQRDEDQRAFERGMQFLCTPVETASEEDARRLRTINDDMRGMP